jgi:hypothetical protein
MNGFADAAQREPRVESPDQPRWHNHLLEVRPESRAQKVWLYKQLFHAVKELGHQTQKKTLFTLC